uniref:Potassium intermediate/small conductance calcium-activated channel, subfamily N, member 4 n=1 Tax=Salarias fasciatus TaxID=181472 RepID=A0A672HWB4_SALFA
RVDHATESLSELRREKKHDLGDDRHIKNLMFFMVIHSSDMRLEAYFFPPLLISCRSVLQLFIIDHNQVDWRIAVSSHRVLVITLELLVCVIHPVGSYWEVGLHVNSSTNSTPLCFSNHDGELLQDVELLLSVLMFLRLYLVHRAILLHSKVLLSASYRSIGSLNNINFTFRFVLKVLMNKHPARTLLVFILFFWLTASWMLTLCERQTREPTGDMDTALWLVAITFLTVGYGDVAPSTSCGRAVCLFTGVMGVACTAMLVAIVTEKLALNKGEKHVHFFMLDIQISKRVRACRVIFLQYKNTHNLDLKELIVRSMLNATASLTFISMDDYLSISQQIDGCIGNVHIGSYRMRVFGFISVCVTGWDGLPLFQHVFTANLFLYYY